MTDHETPPDEPAGPETALFRLFTEIGIIDQLLRTDAQQRLAPELNMPQFALLCHMVRTGEDSSLVRLARAMQVTKAAMGNTVGRLAGKGLLTLGPDPQDRRGKRVALTAAGRAAHRRALGLLGARFAPLLGDVLPAQRIEQALDTLTGLRAWLDAHRDA